MGSKRTVAAGALIWLAAILLAPGPAMTQEDGCQGRDLLAGLAAEQPESHGAILARAAQVANGEGLFWEVRWPGARPSYLFGTYHDTGAAELVYTAPVRAALSAAETLVVELTDDEQARMQTYIAENPGFVLAPGRNAALARMTRSERRRLETALASRGLDYGDALRLQPWMLFSLLGIPACQLAARSAGSPVFDQILIADARAAGKRVVGLETFETALESLASIDTEATREMLLDLALWQPREEDLRATSLALYAAEQVVALQEFGMALDADLKPIEGAAAAASRRLGAIFTEAVILTRNRAWMDVLVPEMKRGAAFAAFGALHLPHEEGVVALLRARGFEVTRKALR